jgi:hypothetical protein
LQDEPESGTFRCARVWDESIQTAVDAPAVDADEQTVRLAMFAAITLLARAASRLGAA